MQHLDEGTIHAWLDGALDAEESARVEEHVAQCAACSAAVAEARGFAAGASRILTALDQTPGGVAPRSATFDAKPRRSPSLWAALHLTPARAAAAALIFVAAGTALVARYANTPQPRPNEKAEYIMPRVDSTSALGGAAGGGPTATASAEAKPAAPMPQAGDAATGAPGRRKAPPLSARIATSKKTANQATAGVSAGSMSVAPRPSPVAADSTFSMRAMAVDSIRSAAPVAARGLSRSVATAAPSISAAAFGNTLVAATSYSGCYDIVTDAITGLPKRISLDTTRLVDMKVRERAALADMRRIEQHGISTLSDSVRQPLEGAYWQIDPRGGVLISLGAITPRAIQLQRTSKDMLSGSMTYEGREHPITIRRVECHLR
ncbi:MAG: hypothetical protein DMD26_13070 [Gemmatimonadetes bacterium]|nr:MAG: hypothetical protein DMD26_13070 [Gemmatimonadota bacterium]